MNAAAPPCSTRQYGAPPSSHLPIGNETVVRLAEHSQILDALSTLNDASPALKQQDVFVQDLTERLAALKTRLV